MCSNNFPYGTKIPSKPEADYPSLFLTTSKFLQKVLPKKRKTVERNVLASASTIEDSDSDTDYVTEDDIDLSLRLSIHFERFSEKLKFLLII